MRSACPKNLLARLSRKAMTLTELLVATIIIGIIIVGVFSVDLAIRSSRENATKLTQLQLQLSSALLRISQAATQTTGHFSASQLPAEEGIYIARTPNVSDTVCFRQDSTTTLTPDLYDDDTWRCFQQDLIPASGTYRQVVTCNVTTTANLPCPTTDIIHPGLANDLADTGYFTINRDASNRIEYIEITLTAIPNSAISEHPVSNPRISLTTRVRPPGLSQ